MNRDRRLERGSGGPDAMVERRRADVARQWREVKEIFRAGTGLPPESLAWAVGIAGMAVGLELARRWLGSAGRRR